MSEARGGIRAFLAIPPDPGWVESAQKLVARLRPALPGASWSRPENWHLTLRFLADVSPPAVAGFMAEVAAAAGETPAVLLAADRALLFPAHGPPRVFAVGFAPGPQSEAVVVLAGEAERAARRLGLEGEGRPFRPHVTLARWRGRCPRATAEHYRSEVGGWVFPPWRAKRCVLYESRLGPGGAVHIPLAEWDLAGGRSAEASA